jgi:hypothetical protein
MRPVEPEMLLLGVVLLIAIVSRTFLPRTRVRDLRIEGRIRVCVSCGAGKKDIADLVTRYLSASCKRYDVVFGVIVECTRTGDVESTRGLAPEHKDRLQVHHTTPVRAEDHRKRHRKLFRTFVNGLEDLVVFADPRVAPEYAWDEHLMLACGREDDPVTVTAPLCGHAAGFPTLRERSNGDVVRDEARAFANEGTAFVPSVCPCYEFVAFRPRHFLWDAETRVLLPAFPLIRPVAPHVEEDVLDANLQRLREKLTHSEKLGITSEPSGSELYYKYGSATAARLAVKLDRKGRAEGGGSPPA